MVLVTGASGFVGNALVVRLASKSPSVVVVAAVRQLNKCWPNGVNPIQVGDLLPNTDWRTALRGVDSVIHCSARAHLMKDNATDSLDAYRQVNVLGTVNLASQAAKAGVRRFVFVSSIKVNGEATQTGRPFMADDIPSPIDPYGVSKMEAENGLRELCFRTGMELVIVRPVLVYGAGVKANFANMMRWVQSGVPLPLGRIHNSRSFVALDNLVDLLINCLIHSSAAGQTFLVSDGEDVSTSELLRRIAHAMGKTAFLLPLPASWIELAATFLGKQELAQRLCGSLQVNIEKNQRLLGWRPSLTLDEGLKKAVGGMLN